MSDLIVKDEDGKQRLVLYDDFPEIDDSNDSEYLSAEKIKKMLKHEKNPMRIKQLNKMLYDLVNYIRKSNKSSYKLAKELKVDPSTIRDVRNNKAWRHIV